MNYDYREILELQKTWEAAYETNYETGERSVDFVSGNQWAFHERRKRADVNEMSHVFNMIQKYMLKVKGEAEKLELRLKIEGAKDPKLLSEGKKVLEHYILHNDNLSAFRKALMNVYDFGFGAVLVGTKNIGCLEKGPEIIPSVVNISNLRKVFFDTSAMSNCKTDGRFCGLMYVVPRGYYSKRGLNEELFSGDAEEENQRIIEFWYREPREKLFYMHADGIWRKERVKNALGKTKVRSHQVKYMKIVNGKVVQKPVDYWTRDKLPIVYWKGMESKIGADVKTAPYAFSMADAQMFVNLSVSAMVTRINRLGGTKYVVTPEMIQGKEKEWENINKQSGIILMNSSTNDGLGEISQTAPQVIPPEPIDPNLVNSVNLSLQLMDQLSGLNAAQQGQGEGGVAVTNAGLHRQIMQGNVVQNVILQNHLEGINEVGAILRQVIPNVIYGEKKIADNLYVNHKPETFSPSNCQLRNDIKRVFGEIDFSLDYGASSEAEKASNLAAADAILQRVPQAFNLIGDEYIENMNTSNSDVLKRRFETQMDPDVQKVGAGEMSLEEYRQKKQQEQQQQEQTPPIEQQKLDLEKQKVEMAAQHKQQEIGIKQAKLENQVKKDGANVKLKAAGIVAKETPKEMIYEKEGGYEKEEVS